jgi:hypothetical protein
MFAHCCCVELAISVLTCDLKPAVQRVELQRDCTTSAHVFNLQSYLGWAMAAWGSGENITSCVVGGLQHLVTDFGFW